MTKKSLELIDIGKVQLLLPNVLLHFITKTIQTSENGSFIHSPHSLNLTILLDEKTVALSVAVLLRGYSRTNIRYDAFFNTSIDIFL